MNEHENKRRVERAYELIAGGDIPSFLKLLAADVRWRLPEMENVPFAGIWHGREGVAQFFGKLADVQEIVEFEPERFIAQEDQVVVLGRFLMRIKPGGIEFSSDWAHVWTVQRGEVVDFYEYVDTAAVSRAHTAASSVSRSAANAG